LSQARTTPARLHLLAPRSRARAGQDEFDCIRLT